MLNDITEAAVNDDGGAKNVDLNHVISLLGKIYIALEVLLKNLKVIVKANVVLSPSTCQNCCWSLTCAYFIFSLACTYGHILVRMLS